MIWQFDAFKIETHRNEIDIKDMGLDPKRITPGKARSLRGNITGAIPVSLTPVSFPSDESRVWIGEQVEYGSISLTLRQRGKEESIALGGERGA
jgi:hypothetical protein